MSLFPAVLAALAYCGSVQIDTICARSPSRTWVWQSVFPVRKRRSDVAGRSGLDLMVLRSFRVIYGAVREHFHQVRRECGISGSQLWILHEVAQTDGIGISELAGRLSIHQSTCSLLVEKLVRAGYVRKSRQRRDQRRVHLIVSARGRRTLERAPGPAEGVLPEALEDLTQAELRRLQRSLQLVIAGINLRDESAAERPLADL